MGRTHLDHGHGGGGGPWGHFAASRRQPRRGSSVGAAPPRTPGHAGDLEEPRRSQRSQRSQPWRGEERVPCKTLERRLVGRGAGRALRPTPAAHSAAHPRPAAPKGAPARPRMLQDSGPAGPPAQVRAGHSRGHRRHCPHRGSLGTAGGTRPVTHPVPSVVLAVWRSSVWGLVAAQTRPALARRLFPPSVPPFVPPCASVSPAWLPARVRGVRAVWSHAGHSLAQRRWHGQPWGPGRGDRSSVLLRGWERTRRPQEPGLPGNVALSPRERVTEVPPGWGVVSGCFRDPRSGLFNSVSLQLRSDPLGSPSVSLCMFSLC